MTRRLRSAKKDEDKVDCLRNMYLVLPYIPEMQPDWIEAFDRIAVAPPTEGDLSYLAKTLSDAHSIYLLKNRGGKDGVPVRVEPQNPEALPIAIQNIKRTLSTTPDKFNNDVLTANTRLDEGRLDLPIDDFLVDLYALGLEEAQILTSPGNKLTAQQVWPYVVAAYSTNGTPRPCWFIIRHCDEIDQLISYVKRAEKCGNGYFKRRAATLLLALKALKEETVLSVGNSKDSIFKEILPYAIKKENMPEEQKKPFSPAFLHKNILTEKASVIIHEYVTGTKNAGNALSSIMELDDLAEGDRKAALALLNLCYTSDNKNGLVSVIRTKHLKSQLSIARKMMFFADFIDFGPSLK